MPYTQAFQVTFSFLSSRVFLWSKSINCIASLLVSKILLISIDLSQLYLVIGSEKYRAKLMAESDSPLSSTYNSESDSEKVVRGLFQHPKCYLTLIEVEQRTNTQ